MKFQLYFEWLIYTELGNAPGLHFRNLVTLIYTLLWESRIHLSKNKQNKPDIYYEGEQVKCGVKIARYIFRDENTY